MVTNFLSPQNIRPYIQNLKVSHFIGEWLQKEKNSNILVKNLSEIVLDILHKLEDDAVVNFISKKAKEMTGDFKINQILGNGMEYLLEKMTIKNSLPVYRNKSKTIFWNTTKW